MQLKLGIGSDVYEKTIPVNLIYEPSCLYWALDSKPEPTNVTA